jgi:putative sigma-54 modulation protein
MIKKIEIAGIHTEADKEIRKYVTKKIAKLDVYLPKHARKSAHAEVKLEESKLKTRKQCTAEVTLFIPGEVITAKETTVNMYAAIDIVEEKLKTQIRRYKSLSSSTKNGRGAQVRAFLGKIVRKK